MAESPYRGTYRIDDQVREPNEDERRLIDERRQRELDIRRKNELGGPRSVLTMGALALLALMGGAFLGHWPTVLGSAVLVVLCGGLGWSGYRQGLARIAKYRGRWDEPDDEWRTHVTRIQARSVLYAASEDEDYITWIVFEIPGGEWAAIDDLWLPPESRDVAKADVRITWLEPAQECLAVEVEGAALPRHGAVRLGERDYDGDDFAKAIEDGFGWSDEEAYEVGIAVGEGPIRRVPESELAPWMVDVVKES